MTLSSQTQKSVRQLILSIHCLMLKKLSQLQTIPEKSDNFMTLSSQTQKSVRQLILSIHFLMHFPLEEQV